MELIIILILGIFGWALYRLINRLGRASRIMKQASATLSDMMLTSLYKDYDTNKPRLLAIPCFGEMWREFDKSLEKDPKGERLTAGADPEQVFDEERLIHQFCRQSSIQAIPPILTGLGIFGTFIGVYIGLHGFQSGSTEALETSIDTLMGGMSAAFLTSLWGIGAGLLLSIVINRYYSSARKNHRALLGIICQFFSYDHGESYLGRLCGTTEEMLTSIKNLKEDLVEPMEIAMEKAVDATISPVMSELRESVEEMTRFKKETSSAAIEKLIETFSEKITGASNHQVGALGSTLDHAANVISESTHRFQLLVKQIEQTMLTQDAAMQRHLEEMKQTEGMVKDFNETVGHVKEFASTLQILSEDTKTIMASNASMTRDFMETTKTILTDMREVTSKADTLWDKHKLSFQKLSEAIDSGISRYTEGVVGSLHKILGEFDSELGHAVRSLAGLLSELEENVGEMNEVLSGFSPEQDSDGSRA